MQKQLVDMDVGEKLTSDWRIVTYTDVDMFCSISGMREEPFLDDNAAIALGFKARVVPGVFISAVMLGMVADRLHGNVHMETNKMKFLAPLHPYDRIRMEGELLSKKETSKKDRIFIVWAWKVKNQDDVLIAEGEYT